jgi:hypothetical protein
MKFVSGYRRGCVGAKRESMRENPEKGIEYFRVLNALPAFSADDRPRTKHHRFRTPMRKNFAALPSVWV